MIAHKVNHRRGIFLLLPATALSEGKKIHHHHPITCIYQWGFRMIWWSVKAKYIFYQNQAKQLSSSSWSSYQSIIIMWHILPDIETKEQLQGLFFDLWWLFCWYVVYGYMLCVFSFVVKKPMWNYFTTNVIIYNTLLLFCVTRQAFNILVFHWTLPQGFLFTYYDAPLFCDAYK